MLVTLARMNKDEMSTSFGHGDEEKLGYLLLVGRPDGLCTA